MKKSEVVQLAAVAAGIVGGGIGYWLAPSAPWWSYVLVGVLVASVGYQGAMRTLADKAIVDNETDR